MFSRFCTISCVREAVYISHGFRILPGPLGLENDINTSICFLHFSSKVTSPRKSHRTCIGTPLEAGEPQMDYKGSHCFFGISKIESTSEGQLSNRKSSIGGTFLLFEERAEKGRRKFLEGTTHILRTSRPRFVEVWT